MDCCKWVHPNGNGTHFEPYEECYVDDPDECLYGYHSCSKRDGSTCGLEYSTPQQMAFCQIDTPFKWPGMIQLPEQLEQQLFNPFVTHNDSGYFGPGDTQPIIPQSQSLATGNKEDYAELVSRLVPPTPPSDTRLMDLEEKYRPMWEEYGQEYDSVMVFYDKHPEYLDELTALGLALGSPMLIDRPVSYFDNAFEHLHNIFDLRTACNGSTIDNRCVEFNIERVESDERMNEKLFCGYNNAVLTTQVECTPYELITDYAAAWNFLDTTKTHLQVEVSYNESDTFKGEDRNGPSDVNRANLAVNMATQAFVKWTLGDNYGVRLNSLREMPRQRSRLELDFASLIGPSFFLYLMQFPAPAMLVALVTEREQNLHTRMRMQGLNMGAHYIGVYAWNAILYIGVILLLFIAGGPVFQLQFILKSDLSLLFVFLFLYGNVQIVCVFLLSYLFKTARSASISSVLWIILTGFLCGQLLTSLFAKEYWYLLLIELVPTCSLYRGLFEFAEYSFLGVYTRASGLTWSKMGDDGNGIDEVMIILFVEWLVFLVWSFLLHEETMLESLQERIAPKGLAKEIEMGAVSRPKVGASASSVNVTVETPDVAEEQHRVQELMSSDDKGAVLACNLTKIYNQGRLNQKLVCDGLHLGINHGECFGILGPNGAGKSTIINMLVGFVDPTSGDAFISNNDIKYQKGRIFKSLGVCPQFDLLWPMLTANQHLKFYGRIRGLSGVDLEEAVNQALRSVNLLDVKFKRAGEYSGGMKRRLSVAISLIGKPKVVLMDEPTTGLDPASRQELWSAIMAAKEFAAIILTTHSMEEAEALCDRIAVFANTQLRCIGSPRSLTNRFGDYLVLTATGMPENADRIGSLVNAKISASSKVVYSLNGVQKFELKVAEVTYANIFNVMSAAKDGGLIQDWGVSTASLEDVFLKVVSDIS